MFLDEKRRRSNLWTPSKKILKESYMSERLEGVRTNGAANGVTNGAYRNLDFEDL